MIKEAVAQLLFNILCHVRFLQLSVISAAEKHPQQTALCGAAAVVCSFVHIANEKFYGFCLMKLVFFILS